MVYYVISIATLERHSMSHMSFSIVLLPIPASHLHVCGVRVWSHMCAYVFIVFTFMVCTSIYTDVTDSTGADVTDSTGADRR